MKRLMGHDRRNDAKTVSIIALGCFHPVVKVQSASLHFFLGSDEEKEDSDDEEEDVRAVLFAALKVCAEWTG